jgi:hypothetical protein
LSFHLHAADQRPWKGLPSMLFESVLGVKF